MDPLLPPLPPLSAVNAASDLIDSSPRSRAAVDALSDESLPAKLRFMCSYGGHIIPRPHDNSLCYVGGETRMVAMDRHSSLSDLSLRLSRSLLSGRPFTLKYQLPNEDLDSLISVSTDEDLDNMIDEYDRTVSVSPLKPSRLRLFLFFNKPETVASMGTLLDDAKSETWFVDALNNSGILPRGLSDSATMDCLLNLDGVVTVDSGTDLEAQVKTVHDLHSMPDSPMIENSSSYGSSSSSPSMANLPPIRVRVADQDGLSGVARTQEQRLVGIEEQFGHMTMAPSNLNDGFNLLSAPLPPMPSSIVQGNLMNVAVNQMTTPSENANQVVSEDERTDQGVPVTFRKPPLPLQPIQVQPLQQRASAAFNLQSPDSVTSDSSIASASSLSRPAVYEDQFQAAMKDQRCPPSPTPKGNDLSPNPTSNAQMQQLQESGYVLSHQPDHSQQQQQPQQYVQMTAHYLPHHPPTNQVLSYYPMYATQSQQQQQQQQYQINQQQPMYVMSVPHQNQPYNMSMQVQQNVNESSGLVTSRPPPSPSPNIVQQPAYSTKAAAAQMQPEMAASIYSSYMSPQLIQVPSSQYPQQHMGMSQMNHLVSSQSIAAASSASGNYGLDYSLQGHDQVYYSQAPPQYQTMTAAAAVALSDASKQQPPMDTCKQQTNA